jgi:hypothetical protein
LSKNIDSSIIQLRDTDSFGYKGILQIETGQGIGMNQEQEICISLNSSENLINRSVLS